MNAGGLPATLPVTAWRVANVGPLGGEVRVDGSKNAALPLLAAAGLAAHPVRVAAVPRSRDVSVMLGLIERCGLTVTHGSEGVSIDGSITARASGDELAAAADIRASYYLVPVLLATVASATFPWPGGCSVGDRGMELHFGVYTAFGDCVSMDDAGYTVTAGAHMRSIVRIRLPFRSRGATIAALLRAIGARRPLRLIGPNMSPEVRCVAAALASIGHHVDLTHDELMVDPASAAGECAGSWRVPGDKVEAGTLLLALAVTRGRGTVRGVPFSHLAPLIGVLADAGLLIEPRDDSVMLDARTPVMGPGGVRARATLDPGGLDADFEPGLLALALTLPGTHEGEDGINRGDTPT